MRAPAPAFFHAQHMRTLYRTQRGVPRELRRLYGCLLTIACFVNRFARNSWNNA